MEVKINGRHRFYDHLHDLEQVSSYEYTVYRNSTKYTIFGGKKAGGRRNEWFVECEQWRDPIYTTSLVDSLKLLDTM
jgi:hypothetical protein